MGNSVLGEERQVKRFFATSADAEILVIDKDGYGNTLLSMVAVRKQLYIITLFLDRGARINNRNDKERTPLIEAAL